MHNRQIKFIKQRDSTKWKKGSSRSFSSCVGKVVKDLTPLLPKVKKWQCRQCMVSQELCDNCLGVVFRVGLARSSRFLYRVSMTVWVRLSYNPEAILSKIRSQTKNTVTWYSLGFDIPSGLTLCHFLNRVLSHELFPSFLDGWGPQHGVHLWRFVTQLCPQPILGTPRHPLGPIPRNSCHPRTE